MNEKEMIEAVALEVAKMNTKTAEAKEKEDAQVKILAENEVLKAKVAELEATPTTKAPGIFSIGTPDLYKGYSIKKQFTRHMDLAPSNDQEREKAVKEMLDIIDVYNQKGIVNPKILKAAMQVGTATEGGNLVPETWAANIEMKAALFSVALQDTKGFTFPMGSGELNIPKQATGMTITWANEEAASTESEPTVGNLQLVAKRGGFWSILSNELMEDSGYDVVGYLTEEATRAMAQEIDAQVFKGTAFTGLLPSVTTNEFKVGKTISAVGAGTSLGDITALDLINMVQTLPASRRMGAKFYLPKEAVTFIRALVNDQGFSIMGTIGGVQANTICGYPFVEVDAISGTDTALAQDMIVFGNLKNYALATKLMPNSVEMNPWSGSEFKQYQTLFRMYMRANGAPLFEDNFVLLGTAAD